MQDWLGIAVRLNRSFKYKIACRRECDGLIKMRRHGGIFRVAGILFVDDARHAPHCVHDLMLGGNAVLEPVGDVLAGNA
jgi:hypothetical protein